eukprot:CAMPEP_0117679956 /NCGR_PEP_ID=MMETSP0804-20121206/18082_1 /TAXON_ID=1074897 /ORGANISM="Tetraselmis astigmatica, Strain CCMP880" /LENGTH=101 /DNA_ID=CAMNT_0005489395 /DNA_START=128 /DNA_END=433 /DNA_ORIENTATION=-
MAQRLMSVAGATASKSLGPAGTRAPAWLDAVCQSSGGMTTGLFASRAAAEAVAPSRLTLRCLASVGLALSPAQTPEALAVAVSRACTSLLFGAVEEDSDDV